MKSFDHNKLKHVETAEKNPLPTQADIKEELRPDTLPDVSAVKDFDAKKLKHVETQEKTVMPTTDGKIFISLLQPFLTRNGIGATFMTHEFEYPLLKKPHGF